MKLLVYLLFCEKQRDYYQNIRNIGVNQFDCEDLIDSKDIIKSFINITDLDPILTLTPTGKIKAIEHLFRTQLTIDL